MDPSRESGQPADRLSPRPCTDMSWVNRAAARRQQSIDQSREYLAKLPIHLYLVPCIHPKRGSLNMLGCLMGRWCRCGASLAAYRSWHDEHIRVVPTEVLGDHNSLVGAARSWLWALSCGRRSCWSYRRYRPAGSPTSRSSRWCCCAIIPSD
jgi:hypothetical protein